MICLFVSSLIVLALDIKGIMLCVIDKTNPPNLDRRLTSKKHKKALFFFFWDLSWVRKPER